VKKKEKVVLVLTDTLTRINQSWLSHQLSLWDQTIIPYIEFNKNKQKKKGEEKQNKVKEI
jgi:hypothetical protein